MSGFEMTCRSSKDGDEAGDGRKSVGLYLPHCGSGPSRSPLSSLR